MAPLNILVPLDSTGPLHLVVLRDLKLSLVQVVKTDWAVGVHIKLMDIPEPLYLLSHCSGKSVYHIMGLGLVI